MSEFGRRLKANESAGTDHGHGNVFFALGGNIQGGRIYGKWPGLANEQLDQGVDLAVSTDYRLPLAKILARRLKNPAIQEVFPDFKAGNFLGIARSP